MYEYANPDNWYRSFDIREDEEPVAVCDDCGYLYEEDYDEGHCRCKLCGKSAIGTDEV